MPLSQLTFPIDDGCLEPLRFWAKMTFVFNFSLFNFCDFDF